MPLPEVDNDQNRGRGTEVSITSAWQQARRPALCAGQL